MNYDILELLYVGLLRGCELGLVEPEANKNYRRIEMTNIDWFRFSETHICNASAIRFPLATADWGVILNFGLFDKPIGGKLLVIGKLFKKISIRENESVEFSRGRITIELEAFNFSEEKNG